MEQSLITEEACESLNINRNRFLLLEYQVSPKSSSPLKSGSEKFVLQFLIFMASW